MVTGNWGLLPAGMNERSLRSEFKSASAEAEKAFKNAGVYIEKLIENPRHVEVQVIADQQGNVVHLWERDCTMQRKHQKLIEESPAPNLPLAVREDICKGVPVGQLGVNGCLIGQPIIEVSPIKQIFCQDGRILDQAHQKEVHKNDNQHEDGSGT